MPRYLDSETLSTCLQCKSNTWVAIVRQNKCVLPSKRCWAISGNIKRVSSITGIRFTGSTKELSGTCLLKAHFNKSSFILNSQGWVVGTKSKPSVRNWKIGLAKFLTWWVSWLLLSEQVSGLAASHFLLPSLVRLGLNIDFDLRSFLHWD